MNMTIIAAPLVGGAIGLITNGIAIRMLFRPLKPLKIGKWTVPFTPGLIPKEKPRIAKAIGHTVGEYLLDAESLQNALASEEMEEKFGQKVEEVINGIGAREGTVEDFLRKKELSEKVWEAEAVLSTRVSAYMTEELIEKNVAENLMDYALEKVLGNLNPMVSMFAGPAVEQARPAITEKVNEMIRAELPEIIKGYTDSVCEKWMNKTMLEVGIWLWPMKEEIKEKLWAFYKKIVEEKAADFLKELNISAIVEEKICQMDESFLEKLILDIARKELHALVWIGGVLGMIIGSVNLLF